MGPYRTPPAPTKPERPRGCPCGTSVETRLAYGAVGGWWHTDECLQWQKDMQLYESLTQGSRP